MVTMRSSLGTKDDNTLSMVVFPASVPPETTTLSRPNTHASMNAAEGPVNVLLAMRSLAARASAENLRTVRNGPPTARGWTTALMREPSGSRASTIGDDSSTRRLTSPTILSMTRRRCDSLEESDLRLLDLALALDVDPLGPVDHDLCHLRVVEERLDGTVTEDVVGDVLAQSSPVRQRERRGLVRQGGLELATDLPAEVVRCHPAFGQSRGRSRRSSADGPEGGLLRASGSGRLEQELPLRAVRQKATSHTP